MFVEIRGGEVSKCIEPTGAVKLLEVVIEVITEVVMYLNIPADCAEVVL